MKRWCAYTGITQGISIPRAEMQGISIASVRLAPKLILVFILNKFPKAPSVIFGARIYPNVRDVQALRSGTSFPQTVCYECNEYTNKKKRKELQRCNILLIACLRLVFAFKRQMFKLNVASLSRRATACISFFPEKAIWTNLCGNKYSNACSLIFLQLVIFHASQIAFFVIENNKCSNYVVVFMYGFHVLLFLKFPKLISFFSLSDSVCVCTINMTYLHCIFLQLPENVGSSPVFQTALSTSLKHFHHCIKKVKLPQPTPPCIFDPPSVMWKTFLNGIDKPSL